MAAEGALAEHGIRLVANLDLDSVLGAGDAGACCAAAYEHPAVRWLLGDELHPGGEATTRRALNLIGVGGRDRLLDLACGQGTSAFLAARERGCEVVGVDRGESSLAEARERVAAQTLGARVSFRTADASALPFPDASFTAILCECSVSTFADKAGAVAEMRRVLVPGGRIAVSDVVVDGDFLPEQLRGPLAAIACVGGALDAAGYTRLLRESGFELTAVEAHNDEAARLASRVEDRLRGVRVLGIPGIDDFVEMAGRARAAIADGILGYSTFTALRP